MCVIEKDPGSPKIERLHIIHLFEVDYNFVLKLIWGRRLVYQGEDNGCFGNQQFARPRHQCIDAMYKKILTYDMACIMLITFVIFDNDASGCYDWIIVALGMIAALHLNLPKSGAKMHGGALK